MGNFAYGQKLGEIKLHRGLRQHHDEMTTNFYLSNFFGAVKWKIQRKQIWEDNDVQEC